MVRLTRILLGIIATALCLFAFRAPDAPPGNPPKKTYHIYESSRWVDSLMRNMTMDEKIGQLFMVDAFTSKDKINTEELHNLVDKYHIGGVIFFKGSPYKEAELTNDLQARSRVPLMVGIDGEWGLAMRLDSTINFGYQMPLGAIQDDSIPYKMGKEIARECKRLGIQVNFAPVVDINNNPLNPVINLRSFGENKEVVTRKSYMYMQGMQDEHVLAVAKHFPGHGNTDVDSHLDLPVLNQTREQMDTLELYPFRFMFSHGVGGVMTAHLHIPAYDTTAHVGASLSPQVSIDLLRRRCKFNGLAFSDALNMKGVAKYFAPGELELLALMAGNDILLYSENVPKAVEVIKAALDSGCLDSEYINIRVRRILEAKKWCGLDHCQYIDLHNVTEDLNEPKGLILKEKIAEQAVTVVKNDFNLIPLKNLEHRHIASVGFGTRVELPFQEMLKMYSKEDYFYQSMYAKDSDWQKLRDTLKNYDLVIFSLHHLSNRNTGTYGLTEKTINFINEVNKIKPCILVSFGSPYALSRFPKFNTILCAYEDDIGFQQAAAQALFGAISARGRLPVTASPDYKVKSGVSTSHYAKLKRAFPEEAGMSSKVLTQIDSLANNAIQKGAMPGCQILVAKEGKVVYQKSFGHPVYSNADVVKNSNLYDIASVTKVAATTMAAMKLYEQGRLKLFDPISKYLPELKGTNKEDLQIKELMTHQAGLVGWIPLYKDRFKITGVQDTIYCSEQNDLYQTRVADHIYLNKFYKDTIYHIFDRSPIQNRGKYLYSDLGFIYMQRVIERITGKSLDSLVDSMFYRPLGLGTMTYKPREKFPLNDIIPTEKDTYFRHELIRGDVHDPTAALLGGVSGNAGLFSDANDLAVLLQMLMNGGTYSGKRYLDASTIALFTGKQYENSRRGLGWDKPEPDISHGSPASQYASPKAYGHTGFTGTCVWADPQYNLIYIFLSNRVYPTEDNNKLVKMNVRTDIHDVIYKSFLKEQ